jgi:lipid II:glycine glycyltransferase (peptidoglycan interpeptide bridge formation enzyme)
VRYAFRVKFRFLRTFAGLAMSYGYRIRPVRDVQEWEECFNAIERPHLMQSHAYGEAKKHAQQWHINRYVFERFGTPLAICQVLEKRLAGLRIASRINRGPLFLEESPPCNVKEHVMRLVRDHWKVFRGGPLLIAPALDMSEENRSVLLQLGFRDRKKYCHWSSLIDLRPAESEMRKRLASNWRNHLKLSERSGLELRTSNSAESVEWMLERHAENMETKNFHGPDKALLQALYQERPADFLVLQAVFEGEPLAGMILARCGQKAEYYIGWFGSAGRKYNCGNFLCWNAALEMKKAGCKWLDLGGYGSNDKFGHFKQGMRGMEYKLIGEWVCF